MKLPTTEMLEKASKIVHIAMKDALAKNEVPIDALFYAHLDFVAYCLARNEQGASEMMDTFVYIAVMKEKYEQLFKNKE